MNPFVWLSRTTSMRRLGKQLDRWARAALEAVLDVVWPPAANGRLPDADAVRSVLFVRPNFRIGNTILSTALLPALQARFPVARIDYLGADKTACLLDGLPINRVHCVSRLFLLAPWRFVSLFLRLRRQRFDLAVDGGIGSFSGAFYSYLSGAAQRLGGEGRSNRFLTVRLRLQSVANAYDTASAFARELQVQAPDWPMYRVSAAESAAALVTLSELGLTTDSTVTPFIAAFVGGHQGKRWPRHSWLALFEQLDSAGIPVVVFIGPEELDFADTLHSQARGGSLRVVSPKPLRIFASLLAPATLLVTPDSGPMHLAAALGVPVVSLIQAEWSRFYAPPGVENRVLVQATHADVLAVLQAHPRWTLFGVGQPHRSPRVAIPM